MPRHQRKGVSVPASFQLNQVDARKAMDGQGTVVKGQGKESTAWVPDPAFSSRLNWRLRVDQLRKCSSVALLTTPGFDELMALLHLRYRRQLISVEHAVKEKGIKFLAVSICRRLHIILQHNGY